MSKQELGLGETKLKRPMDKLAMGQEVQALNALLNMMNDPNRQPAESKVRIEKPKEMKQQQPPTLPAAQIPTPTAEPPPAPVSSVAPSKIFFTGRLKVGKDYLANEIGATIFGLADPLYYLAKHFSGVDISSGKNKDLPGMRAFLQTIGQWGRGVINEQYPWTPARACFVTMIHSLAAVNVISGQGVDWERYGLDDTLWISAALSRISESNAALSAVTNVRFENEFKLLQENGWTHYHVMASSGTHKERLTKDGIPLDSPVLKDISERLAAGLDANVTKQVSAQRHGPRLHCVWNDERTPAISDRLYSVPQFKALFVAAAPQQHINTGE